MTPHPARPFDAPSPWITRFAPLVPGGGTVLDLACGGGRHTRLFLGRGHPVTAVDLDLRGLDDLRGAAGLTLLQADLEGAPWPLSGRFAGIIVTNYLHRPLFSSLLAALAPGGVLLYETFARGNERFGRPASPAFLLRAGELLDLARNPTGAALQVVAYEHGVVASPKAAVVQRLCALQLPEGASEAEPEPAPLPAP
jgi:SAM-dependent methyltransferase